jgi:hypothetical protein
MQGNWLTITEAAELIGISAEALRARCNHRCPHSGRHAPLIEHARHGSRGRPNARTGLKGTIMIRRDVAEEYLKTCLHSPIEPALPVAHFVPKPYVRRNF